MPQLKKEYYVDKVYLKESESFGDWWDKSCSDAFHHDHPGSRCYIKSRELSSAEKNYPIHQLDFFVAEVGSG